MGAAEEIGEPAVGGTSEMRGTKSEGTMIEEERLHQCEQEGTMTGEEKKRETMTVQGRKNEETTTLHPREHDGMMIGDEKKREMKTAQGKTEKNEETTTNAKRKRERKIVNKKTREMMTEGKRKRGEPRLHRDESRLLSCVRIARKKIAETTIGKKMRTGEKMIREKTNATWKNGEMTTRKEMKRKRKIDRRKTAKTKRPGGRNWLHGGRKKERRKNEGWKKKNGNSKNAYT